MAEFGYRVHRIADTETHRAHSIQCLSDNGVVIALAAARDGEDGGLAICSKDSDTGSFAIEHVLDVPEPEMLDINLAGQFVGWSLRSGREHALVGRTDPLQFDVWPGHSGATAIDARGRFVGFRRTRGAFSAFLQDGPNLIDLEPPSSVGRLGYRAISIAADRILGTGFAAAATVLLWGATGQLVNQIEVDFGGPIRLNAAGDILCQYGIVKQRTHAWFPYAPRCSDFIARSMNASGNVVGFGRALDRVGSTYACLWGPNGLSRNVNDLVSDPRTHLREAVAINDGGWIACSDADGAPILLEPLD